MEKTILSFVINRAMEFVFYYKDHLRSVTSKEKAVELFNAGGFYKAACYFSKEHPACFRIIETVEDITSIK